MSSSQSKGTMKVLVTGGAGFIGSHTSEALLRRGNQVVIVDEMNDFYDPALKQANICFLQELAAEMTVQNPRYAGSVCLYVGDICDEQFIDSVFAIERPDIICHLAARAGVRPSISDPNIYIHSNIRGTVSMLEMARKYAVKNFVYASSSSVYGGNKKVPFSESDPVENMISPYAVTKRTAELMAATFHNLYKVPVTGLRFFTVYGPRGRPDMAPFMFVDKIYRGEPIVRFGNGGTGRDYTYVGDVVLGIVAAIDKPHDNEIFNLGNSSVVSLSQFIQVIEEILGKKAVIVEKPIQAGDVALTYADLTKAQDMLGYTPKTAIEQGMRQFIAWYCASRNSTLSR